MKTPFISIFVIALLISMSACSNRESAKTVEKKDSIAIETNVDSIPVAGVTEKLNPPPPPPPPSSSKEIKPSQKTNIQPTNDEQESIYTSLKKSKLDRPELELGIERQIEETDSVFTIVDEKAKFRGGQDAFNLYLEDKLIYPEKLFAQNISGTTYVKFIVEKNGIVRDVTVVKTSGQNALDIEAVRVIKKTSGKWAPGKIKGQAVSSYLSLPIVFEIDE